LAELSEVRRTLDGPSSVVPEAGQLADEAAGRTVAEKMIETTSADVTPHPFGYSPRGFLSHEMSELIKDLPGRNATAAEDVAPLPRPPCDASHSVVSITRHCTYVDPAAG
jgi:hypothetical protein